MKKLLSIRYSAGAFNFSVFLLRLVFGILLLVNHGYDKLINFSEKQNTFYSFMGLGSRISLILAIFAEVFCSLFIVLGLFTRLAAIPLVITFLVIIFGANAGGSLKDIESGLLYFSAFFFLLLCGPGRISIDGMINK